LGQLPLLSSQSGAWRYAAPGRDANFAPPEQSGLAAILPDPPAQDSDTAKAELPDLHRLEAARTREQVASARFDDENENPVCKTKEKGDAYPSGHATSGYLLALTLIDMVPEKREELLARADDYAHNCLICGVHYARDLEASKLAAYTVHAPMELSARYQSELAAARAELGRSSGVTQRVNFPAGLWCFFCAPHPV
jgi:acid phosphatase (class A)